MTPGRVEVRWPWDEVAIYGPDGDCVAHIEDMGGGWVYLRALNVDADIPLREPQ